LFSGDRAFGPLESLSRDNGGNLSVLCLTSSYSRTELPNTHSNRGADRCAADVETSSANESHLAPAFSADRTGSATSCRCCLRHGVLDLARHPQSDRRRSLDSDLFGRSRGKLGQGPRETELASCVHIRGGLAQWPECGLGGELFLNSCLYT